jgi:hypothetical protein
MVEDVFFTVETGVLPSLSGGSASLLGVLMGVSLDWQVNDRLTATLAREPVQSSLGSILLTPSDIRYQFSADVLGTWEFGRPAQSAPPLPDFENLPIESAPPATPVPESTQPPAESPADASEDNPPEIPQDVPRDNPPQNPPSIPPDGPEAANPDPGEDE